MASTFHNFLKFLPERTIHSSIYEGVDSTGSEDRQGTEQLNPSCHGWYETEADHYSNSPGGYPTDNERQHHHKQSFADFYFLYGDVALSMREVKVGCNV